MKIRTMAFLSTAVALAGGASAASYTFNLNPADLLNQYPANSTGDKSTQSNPRKLSVPGSTNMTWTTTLGNSGNVYDNPSYNGVAQPTAYNTYLNWLDSLGAGKGMTNLYLLVAISGTSYVTNDPSGHPRYNSWGTHVLASSTSAVTMPSPAGWTASGTVPPSYNGIFVGGSWTSASGQFIRPGASLPLFSFTISDLLWDGNNDGIGDRPLQYGDQIQFYLSSDYMTFDANGWGNRAGYAPFSSTGAAWEGAFMFTVPEPSSVSLLGLAAFGFLWRARRKA